MSTKPRYVAAFACVALLTASLAVPVTATADPNWPQPGSEPADATLDHLETMGYTVGINWVNGRGSSPLSACRVTGYHSPDRSGGVDPSSMTVYMDVVCPDEPGD